MASLETTASGNFHVVFWFQGQRYKRALRTNRRREAGLRQARLEDTIRLVECGRIELPKDVDIPLFLLSDGKLGEAPAQTNPTPPPQQSLETVFAAFFASIPPGNLEESTLKPRTIKAYRTALRDHALPFFGADTSIDTIDQKRFSEFVQQ